MGFYWNISGYVRICVGKGFKFQGVLVLLSYRDMC